jgi:cell division protein FtsZ
MDMGAEPMHEPDMPAEEPFIPPMPDAPSRIPRVEDFPPVVQRQVEAQRQPAQQHHEDRGPMSLLRRLAGVGLGRREEEPQQVEPRAQKPAAKAPAQQQRQAAPQPRAAQPAPRQAAGQDSMYKPRQGDLDPQGRALPNAKRQQPEDDLEIPAFLRRQAN